MPQIASNFILRSKLPNFERDQFETLREMHNVNSEWMDEGHISYCKGNGKHYIFCTQDGNLTGAERWTLLYTNTTSENAIDAISVDELGSLNEKLATELPQGSLIYVTSEKTHYCNLYTPGAEESEWFKPIQQDLTPYVTKEEIGDFGDETDKTLVDYIKDQYYSKEDLEQYINKTNQLGNWDTTDENGEVVTLVNHIKDQYYSKEEIGDFTSANGSLVDYIEAKYKVLSDIENEVEKLVSRTELEEYVEEYVEGKIPNTENLATKGDLEDFITIDQVPDLTNTASKDDLKIVDERIDANHALIGQILNNLEDYKNEVQEEYLPKKEAQDTYVNKIDHEHTHTDIGLHLKVIDEKLEELGAVDSEIKETYTTKEEFAGHLDNFEEYKTYVEDTFVKPDEVSEKLNTYHPTEENRNKWIGSDFAGALAGKTGEEVAKENYSYNAVLDQMLFFDFTPTVSLPSVSNIQLVDDWQGPGTTTKWFDKENKIITVRCGTTGPDGGDFHVKEYKDAIISYPKGLDLDNKYTNGPVEQSDEKQSPVGFCKVKDENGEWVYYKREGNIYHVPATFDKEGEYRYYYVAYFKKGSPAVNNEGLAVDVFGEGEVWNENTPVESKDYITFIATKSIHYLNDKNEWVEHGAPIWSSDIVTDYLTLKPSCQQQQAFKLPRKIKGLYIWNDVAGDYAMVPFVYQKDEDGLPTDNMIPAYFDESVDENGYYTYIYDSVKHGHRGEIKIKVTF